MPQTRRERLHEATLAEIKQVARQQMAEQGTAAVSLRAIARQMGMSAPGLYRYYASRDDLITALILDAYNDVADAVEGACARVPAEDYSRRFRVFAHTYYAWAMTHPLEYELILGNPIPGYHAPAELTQPAAQRPMLVLTAILNDAWQAGKLDVPASYAVVPPELEQRMQPWQEAMQVSMPRSFLIFVLLSWARIHGLITLDLFGHLAAIMGDPVLLFNLEIEAEIIQLGLTPPPLAIYS
jgi:AcrR family transcriptional regulator